MKKEIVGTLIIFMSFFATLSGCPTCIGQIHDDSPPFFSKEFYTPSKERMDDLYEKFLVEESTAKSSLNKSATQQPVKKEKS